MVWVRRRHFSRHCSSLSYLLHLQRQGVWRCRRSEEDSDFELSQFVPYQGGVGATERHSSVWCVPSFGAGLGLSSYTSLTCVSCFLVLMLK